MDCSRGDLKMSLNFSFVSRLCAAASELGRSADWTWTGKPVLCWEFATINDFSHARADLLASISPELALADRRSMERLVSSDVAEIDCYGITFRLVCKQRIVMREGPYGAAEIHLPHKP